MYSIPTVSGVLVKLFNTIGKATIIIISDTRFGFALNFLEDFTPLKLGLGNSVLKH